MEVDHVAFGSKMRTLRSREDLSLRKVARVLGLTISFLSDLERGRRNWRPELAQRYEAALRKAKKMEGA